ncbi:MAG: ribosomal protein S18-alanine N-acetyltransferase [Candidatus Bathyarchaeia archaeon]
MSSKAGSSSAYKLRKFREEDLEAVMAINRKCLPEHYTSSFFLDLHKSYPATFLVAEYDGKVVGYVLCRVESGLSEFKRFRFVKKGHLVSLAVMDEHREKGLGSRLLAAALEGMVRYGCRESFLEVRKSNTKAMNLYRKFGYEVTRCIPGYYLDGEDACLMSIILSAEKKQQLTNPRE